MAVQARHDYHHAVVGESSTLLQQGTVGVDEVHAVQVHVPRYDSFQPPTARLRKLQHVAVLHQEHVVFLDAHLLGKGGVGRQPLEFPVDGDEVARLRQRQNRLQLLPRGVSVHVHRGYPVVEDAGALTHQVVDSPVHHLLVARNGGGGDYHRVVRQDANLPVVVSGYSHQRGRRLPLAARGYQHHLLRRKPIRPVQRHQRPRRLLYIAHLGSHSHVVHHAPPRHRHLPPVGRRRVQHQLYSRNEGREGRHQHPRGRLADGLHQRIANHLLRRRESLHFRVGGVRKQCQNSLFAETSQRPQIRRRSVHRRVVDLEVPRVHYQPRRRPNRQPEGVGDAVTDPEPLNLEGAYTEAFALLNQSQVRAVQESVVSQLHPYQPQRQPGRVHRHVQLRQDEGQRARMVFVPVGDEDGPHLAAMLQQI